MSSCDPEDSLTTLNTALNKSMILMDSPIDNRSRIKGGKLIKINTITQPPNPCAETSEVARKSILKKSKTPAISEDLDPLIVARNNKDVEAETRQSIQNRLPRPHNLEDFVKGDTVILDPTDSTFDLADLSDSEEMWVMDVPKTVNPRTLSGQTLLLGEKSKLTVGDERYCAVSKNSGCCLTWVFSTGRSSKPYKAVNIKPAGSVTVRRKLPGTLKKAPDFLDASAVPFPSNLKIRHPFFGPSQDGEETTLPTTTARKEVKTIDRLC